jgi:hypothetical protein
MFKNTEIFLTCADRKYVSELKHRLDEHADDCCDDDTFIKTA